MVSFYVACMKDMRGRGMPHSLYMHIMCVFFVLAAGAMTIGSCRKLENGMEWDQMPFDPFGGGCGGSMRACTVYCRQPTLIKPSVFL